EAAARFEEIENDLNRVIRETVDIPLSGGPQGAIAGFVHGDNGAEFNADYLVVSADLVSMGLTTAFVTPSNRMFDIDFVDFEKVISPNLCEIVPLAPFPLEVPGGLGVGEFLVMMV
ncbi:MAG: hypothetical protein IIA30_14465, partial [Myxococcales bacterium]|nr:hypothetical protein [Myxococcales bacterium]